MRRTIAILLSAVAVAASVAVFAPKAASAHEDACAGLGSATTSLPLFYPGVALTATNADFTFALDTGACAGGGTVLASGDVSGWCGLSSGDGATDTGHRFTWVGVGGTLVVSGEVVGVVNAVPDALNGESCAVGGADRFLVNGAAALGHCLILRQESHTTVAQGLSVWHDICI